MRSSRFCRTRRAPLLALLAFPSGSGVAAAAGTWAPLANPYPAPPIRFADGHTARGGATAPLLLTDGSVLVQNAGPTGNDGRLFRLRPDARGRYVTGRWESFPALPYAPAANAQAVLPDGRIIVEGGEYTGKQGRFSLTNQGAIFDWKAWAWTRVKPPRFFMDLYPPRRAFAPHPIGDAQSVVLANGTFMVADKMSRQAALLDAATLTWRRAPGLGKADLNDEEGWTLLPDGTVLTTDCYTDFAFRLIPAYPADPTGAEIFDPRTRHWSSAGRTVVPLTDRGTFETGPQILRPDGTVFAVGSLGYTAIYDTRTKSWRAGPKLPTSPEGNAYTVQDGPAALLPDGHVLLAASGGPLPSDGGYAAGPVGFLEFDGTGYMPVPAIPNAANDVSGSIGLLILPTGQILETDGSADIEIYSPDATPDPASAPAIRSVARDLTHGATYRLSGYRLNGMSQGSAFGDENQNATNYPLARLTFATGWVVFARTHDHSSMAVAAKGVTETSFDVPAGGPSGPAMLQIVTNGIASRGVAVTVR